MCQRNQYRLRSVHGR